MIASYEHDESKGRTPDHEPACEVLESPRVAQDVAKKVGEVLRENPEADAVAAGRQTAEKIVNRGEYGMEPNGGKDPAEQTLAARQASITAGWEAASRKASQIADGVFDGVSRDIVSTDVAVSDSGYFSPSPTPAEAMPTRNEEIAFSA